MKALVSAVLVLAAAAVFSNQQAHDCAFAALDATRKLRSVSEKAGRLAPNLDAHDLLEVARFQKRVSATNVHILAALKRKDYCIALELARRECAQLQGDARDAGVSLVIPDLQAIRKGLDKFSTHPKK